MGVDILPRRVNFGSLGVDFRTHCELMLGIWEPIWDLLESILASRGELRLLSLNIGLDIDCGSLGVDFWRLWINCGRLGVFSGASMSQF